MRNELAAALAKPLPEDMLRYGQGVQGVSFDEHGVLCAKILCHTHALYPDVSSTPIRGPIGAVLTPSVIRFHLPNVFSTFGGQVTFHAHFGKKMPQKGSYSV